eukprot:TRINITY_DN43087_c0_g1_i1.p1 TRINITY_DN43087_c0_g1~~TRINITY_DN43087_c0_g1_i1.p1  ORF type:complete len:151 (-),score=8.75 TRINITY_DN43087_c0_g1_i1:149-601(-)
MKEFLIEMGKRFELIAYSFLPEEKLKCIVQQIDPEKNIFQYIFSDKFCLFANNFFGVKCLDFLLENRQLSSMILVDTSPKALPLAVNNVIPINPYSVVDLSDCELVKLAGLLVNINDFESIPSSVEKFRESVKATVQFPWPHLNLSLIHI